MRALRIAVALATAGSLGCAQTLALRQPGPLECRETLAVEVARADVVACLGAPDETVDTQDGLLDIFTYEDGRGRNATWSKVGRTFLYTIGDLFTLFLTQLIFVPAEALALEAVDYRAYVKYAADDSGRWRVVEIEETPIE